MRNIFSGLLTGMSSVSTGDDAPIAAMVILLVLAAVGLAVVIIGRKKFLK